MVEDESEKRPRLSHQYAPQGMALEPVFPEMAGGCGPEQGKVHGSEEITARSFHSKP